MDKCCVCGEVLKREEVADEDIPLCEKKECIKEFTRFFGRFCQAVDEETHMETEGFFCGDHLIRYDHFDEDFEKYWQEENEG